MHFPVWPSDISLWKQSAASSVLSCTADRVPQDGAQGFSKGCF